MNDVPPRKRSKKPAKRPAIPTKPLTPEEIRRISGEMRRFFTSANLAQNRERYTKALQKNLFKRVKPEHEKWLVQKIADLEEAFPFSWGFYGALEKLPEQFPDRFT